jgi:pyroglutamyl-peptidase
MKKIVVTAFEPFGGLDTNSSYEVVKRINHEFNGIEMIKETLPVIYNPSLYEDLLNRHQPDVLLLCGQAEGRKLVGIEHVAINLMYAMGPDNQGVIKKGESIVPGGREAYFGTIPTIEIVQQLKEEGYPIELSLSAGGYICNMSYYASRHFSELNDLNTQIAFIHFPLYEGQRNEKGHPTHDIDQLVATLNRIIEQLI